MMEVETIKIRLLNQLEKIEVIDCHEHLGPESERTDTEVDVFSLFSHYTVGDLYAAGMSLTQQQSLLNRNLPLDYRWGLFEPFWENIRYTSYSEAALITARKFYGADDINKNTYQAITEAVKKFNTPGIYNRILKEACNIRTCLTLPLGYTGNELGTPLLTLLKWMPGTNTRSNFLNPEFAPDAVIRTLDDFIDAYKAWLVKCKADGAVALKLFSSPFGEPNRQEAICQFNKLVSGEINDLPERNVIADYVIDEIIKFIGQQDMVMAVHTGYWGDFRQLSPLHMIPVLMRHPNVRFDLFHLGYPFVREAIMMGKGFPNVWLNLCWTHIISKKFAFEAMDELIDTVPVNKIMAFGGDYGSYAVEKVYGHLVMAKDNFAAVMANRIAAKHLTEEQAMSIAQKWFFDNPKALYKLDV